MFQKYFESKLHRFILTNNAPFLPNTKTVSTGLSDFHKIVPTVLKTSMLKTKHKDYKKEIIFLSPENSTEISQKNFHMNV